MRTVLAIVLLSIAGVMTLGAISSDVPITPAYVLALVVGIVIPGGFGAWLLRERFRRDPAGVERRDRLRRETIESELVRLAGAHQGRVTIVEAVSALGLPAEEAKDALDSLVRRGVADIHLTESGLIVYHFDDVRLLDEKPRSRGLLDD